jgi:hypothetical protein
LAAKKAGSSFKQATVARFALESLEGGSPKEQAILISKAIELGALTRDTRHPFNMDQMDLFIRAARIKQNHQPVFAEHMGKHAKEVISNFSSDFSSSRIKTADF